MRTICISHVCAGGHCSLENDTETQSLRGSVSLQQSSLLWSCCLHTLAPLYGYAVIDQNQSVNTTLKEKHLLSPCLVNLIFFQPEAARDAWKTSQISTRLTLINCSFWTDNSGISSTQLQQEIVFFNYFHLFSSQCKAWEGLLIAHRLQT